MRLPWVRGPIVFGLALALAGCGASAGGDNGTSAPEPTSAASDFFVPGGDNSVQAFGEEASAADRRGASRVLGAYLRAREREDRKAACSHLNATAIGSLEKLSGGPATEDACPAALATFDERSAAASRINTLDGEIDSLRVEDDRAFALYHGSDGVDYTIQMSRAGGSWKVAGIVPFPL